MRQVIALVLSLLLATGTSLAGVNSHQAKVSGGSTPAPPTEAVGFLNTDDLEHLDFDYRAGHNRESGNFEANTFSLPYRNVNRLIYGDTRHLRVGQTIALTALAGVGGLLLLLSKSHTHYLSIEYKDANAHDQVVSFEVGKEAIRPALQSLELRTGKKVELESSPGTRPSAVP